MKRECGWDFLPKLTLLIRRTLMTVVTTLVVGSDQCSLIEIGFGGTSLLEWDREEYFYVLFDDLMGGIRTSAASRPLIELVTGSIGWVEMVHRSLNLRYSITIELGAEVDISAFSGIGVMDRRSSLMCSFCRSTFPTSRSLRRMFQRLRWDIGESRRLKGLLWRATFVALSLCIGAHTCSNEGKRRECEVINERYSANAYSNVSRFGNVMNLDINDDGVQRQWNSVSLKPVLIDSKVLGVSTKDELWDTTAGSGNQLNDHDLGTSFLLLAHKVAAKNRGLQVLQRVRQVHMEKIPMPRLVGRNAFSTVY